MECEVKTQNESDTSNQKTIINDMPLLDEFIALLLLKMFLETL